MTVETLIPNEAVEASSAVMPDVPMPCQRASAKSPSKTWIACGIFFLVAAIYTLSSPGRIDMIDGQVRFDVAYNWLVTGHPVLRDVWISSYMGVPGRNGVLYSYYGAAGSVVAMPLVWLGLVTSGPAIQPIQFLFSMTSPIFGAAIAPVLFLFYLELGVTTRKAFAWTMVSSFATYIWPISNSSFDNAQHAFFALLALYLGFRGARRRSLVYATAGGVMAGFLLLYQQYFLLIIPALALATLRWTKKAGFSPIRATATTDSVVSRLIAAVKVGFQDATTFVYAAWDSKGEARSSCVRCGAFLAAACIGQALALAYNDLRFGSPLENGMLLAIHAHAYPLLGNPLAGFLTLLISPGKSIFYYSLTLVIGICGMRRLWRLHPEAALAVLASTTILVLFLSCICFVGGDWCWGPRYLAPLVPLWSLAFPFVPLSRVRRSVVVAIVGVALAVQMMGLSVENQRFFQEKGFSDYFWAEDPWVYFRHSALIDRVGETLSLRNGLPPTARFFNAVPITEWYTYTPLGLPPGMDHRLSPIWMRGFKIFFLPKPWPFWMLYVPTELRPINVPAWLVALLGISVLGVTLIYRGFQEERCQ